MVAAGSGVAVLPESLRSFAGESVVGIPLKGSPAVTHVFAVGRGAASGAMKDFLALLPSAVR
jgi:DNA-binding transcriptional LysR family regulator